MPKKVRSMLIGVTGAVTLVASTQAARAGSMETGLLKESRGRISVRASPLPPTQLREKMRISAAAANIPEPPVMALFVTCLLAISAAHSRRNGS